MENYSEDLGEEIILRLKELIKILELRLKLENGKKFTSPHCN
mgnify:CR=1 FL=1